MVVVSYSGKEINAKLVYYGPGLSGKTTNLEFIYQSVPQQSRGKMVSMKTRTERTLFFDFLPVDLGQLGGFKTRFLLYTVPGQVYYNATRKLVLRGVDAVVFVADSARGKMKENLESLQNLRDNLREYDLDLDKLPWVIQYNKRDLPEVFTVAELEKELNPGGVPCFEAVATTGEGVFETFRGIGKVVLQKLAREVKLEERPARATESRPVPDAAPERPEEAPAPALRAERPSAAMERPSAAMERPSGAFERPGPVPVAPPATARAEESALPEARAAQIAERLKAAQEALQPAAAPRPAPASPVEAGVKAPYAARVESPAEEQPRGFLGRLFGRGRHRDEAVPLPAETRLTRVERAPSSGDSEQGPIVIEKRVQVPVMLSPEEVVRGATLRLVLEVQVTAAESAGQRDVA